MPGIDGAEATDPFWESPRCLGNIVVGSSVHGRTGVQATTWERHGSIELMRVEHRDELLGPFVFGVGSDVRVEIEAQRHRQSCNQLVAFALRTRPCIESSNSASSSRSRSTLGCRNGKSDPNITRCPAPSLINPAIWTGMFTPDVSNHTFGHERARSSAPRASRPPQPAWATTNLTDGCAAARPFRSSRLTST